MALCMRMMSHGTKENPSESQHDAHDTDVHDQSARIARLEAEVNRLRDAQHQFDEHPARSDDT